MATSWFYAHDEVKYGPYSPAELKGLAAAGRILPVDTVWLEGNEKGVPASRVKHLFAPPAAPSDSIAGLKTVPAQIAPAPSEPPPETTAAITKQRRGQATAVSGAEIANQDGVNARYRKKCVKCGQKDSACHTIVITNRTYKTGFFCPKCRKRCDVVIQCKL